MYTFLESSIDRIYFLLLFSLLLGCSPKDLRNNDLQQNGISLENVNKGKSLLMHAIDNQNLMKLNEYKVYSLKASDKWNKQYMMDINPWPGDNGALCEFRMVFNTFDSQVTWLEGELKNHTYGIQSWQLYKYELGNSPVKIEDDDIEFIIPTMQYFLELPARLLNADIVTYMGEEIIDQHTYHKVFVTWETLTPNEHDQYIVYINADTGRVERTTYTIRDNFMWTPSNFYGTAVYSNYVEYKDRIILPQKIEVYPFDNVDKKSVHTFEIVSFNAGGFDIDELYPFPEIPKMGDSK
ncbi:hypothetical protein [Fulvivirga lutea]|uniref:Uncharacterized protein n=1 Tax=Fulvivirga lutea TaxID=2810512 RepID=A0A974WK79_9BACT|nr:hypothetical protein [Fulvivirga lutea]QSE98687.1 hypothetical protein JR347_06300 [Fulvivirga lutea]